MPLSFPGEELIQKENSFRTNRKESVKTFGWDYPLTAPAIKLSWMRLLRKMYTMIVGSVAILSAAPMGPHLVVYWPNNCYTPTGRVRYLPALTKIVANSSSFQHWRKV